MEKRHSRLLTRTKTEVTRRCAGCPSTLPYARPSAPLPSHLVRRDYGRPRRQKLLHHLFVPADRSEMKRGISSLWPAAALRQAHPLSARCVRPLLHPRAPRYNTSTGMQPSKGARKEKRRPTLDSGHTRSVLRSRENQQIKRHSTKTR